MFKDIQAIIDKISDNRRKYQTWQKVVSVLACITVFCTTYALILPAITLESSPDVICGMEEHTHTSDCYQRTPVLICENTDPDHEHTDECYQIDSVLICGKEEHKHSDACFPKEEPTTEQQAVESAASVESVDPSDVSSEEGQVVSSEPETSSQSVVERSSEVDNKQADNVSSDEAEEKAASFTSALIPGARSMLRAAGPKITKAGSGGVVLDKTLQEIDGTTYIRLESYVTGKKVTYTETYSKPADIVLVLDVSGSMDNYSGRRYTQAKKAQMNSLLVGVINGNRVFLKRQSDGAYVEIRVKSDGNSNTNKRKYTYIDAYTDAVLYTSKGTNTVPQFSEEGYEDIIYFMYEDESSDKWIDILKTSAESFVGKVLENARGGEGTDDDVDHRIAVVTFSTNAQTKLGLTNVLTDSQNLTDVIGSLAADGNTHPEKGLQNAAGILSAVKSPDRDQFVVLFTDGVPGDGATWAIAKNSSTTANSAVSTAKTIKDIGADIFTVGIFDGTDSNSDGTMWDANTDINNIPQSAKYANRFMHLVSSNSTDGSTFEKSNEYYISAADSDALVAAFESVVTSVSTGGPNITTLTKRTIVQDVVSDYFELKEGSDPSQIVVKKAPCTGKSGNELTFGTEVDFENAEITVEGSKVKVENFNFSENWCGTDNGAYCGNKLVIYIPIVAKDDFVGGFDVQTNASGSGIIPPGKTEPSWEFDSPSTDVEINDEAIKAALDVNDLCIYSGSSLALTDLYDSGSWENAFKASTTTNYDFSVSPSLSNKSSGTYTIKLTVSPKDSTSTAEAVEKSYTSHVYVKVPQVKWNDSQVLSGETYTREQCLAHKVSEGWVPDGNWTDGSGGVPAVTGSEPELKYTFVNKSTSDTFGSEPTEIIDETKIDVTVQAKYGDDLADVTDLTKFEWECGAPTHGEASSIPAHTGSKEAYPEFYIHAYAGRTLPATGGSGIKIWFIIGLTLMTAPIMIGLSMKRKHDLINVF